jgi:hypothetical protein
MDASEPSSDPSTDSEAGGDSTRWRLAKDEDLRFVDLEVEAAEDDLVVVDLVVVCLALLFALGAAAEDGPALLDARLGGLNGSWRFFCAGPSAIIMIRFLVPGWSLRRVLLRAEDCYWIDGVRPDDAWHVDAGRALLRRGIR